MGPDLVLTFDPIPATCGVP